jgi:hypothetical protein
METMVVHAGLTGKSHGSAGIYKVYKGMVSKQKGFSRAQNLG